MNSPLISIIVPVYNTEKYLDQCIQSVLAQTYTNWELLLIDDGSTDSSGAICDKYAAEDNRIRVFHKENGGVSSARNLGLDNAKGEWITFVDSDDCLYEYALSALYSKSSEVDIVTATIEQIGKVWEQSKLGEIDADRYMKGLLDGTIYGYQYATLYRYSLFADHRTSIPADLKIGEDVLFKLDIARYIKRAINIPDVIYWYRMNPTSAMQRQIRSVSYYLRYFQFRDTLISTELAKLCKHQDICTLIDAFYNPHIPYREQDYKLLCNFVKTYSNSLSSDLFPKINKFKCKYRVILSKTYFYYKTKLIHILLKKPHRVILD